MSFGLIIPHLIIVICIIISNYIIEIRPHVKHQQHIPEDHTSPQIPKRCEYNRHKDSESDLLCNMSLQNVSSKTHISDDSSSEKSRPINCKEASDYKKKKTTEEDQNFKIPKRRDCNRHSLHALSDILCTMYLQNVTRESTIHRPLTLAATTATSPHLSHSRAPKFRTQANSPQISPEHVVWLKMSWYSSGEYYEDITTSPDTWSYEVTTTLYGDET